MNAVDQARAKVVGIERAMLAEPDPIELLRPARAAAQAEGGLVSPMTAKQASRAQDLSETSALAAGA